MDNRRRKKGWKKSTAECKLSFSSHAGRHWQSEIFNTCSLIIGYDKLVTRATLFTCPAEQLLTAGQWNEDSRREIVLMIKLSLYQKDQNVKGLQMNQNYIVRPDTTHALAKFCLDFKTGRKFGKALHERIPYHSKTNS